ncbi:hypothetical protein [Micromonospora sp. 4G55]|uniref:hypothetical protein n=1 Tax=Micromonospora sp. 4G55 TaxID=2806102 RepID=UPI001A546B95|nr:hypothetical protein [Micromonospora sp. 4G55]MBM0257730.1 hypothetical protein [Micromonospora sp. 4G55]
MREMIDAALRRQRILIVVAITFGLLTGVAAEGLRVVGGPLTLLALLPLGYFLWSAVGSLRRPPSAAGLRIDERERVLYAAPREDAIFAPVMVGFWAYQAVDSWARADGDSFLVALAALFALFTVGFAVTFWQRAPGVELTPDGITHRRLERQWFVPWAAMDPTGLIGSPRATWAISLPVTRPGLIRHGRGWGRGRHVLSLRDVDVAPQLLAATIRHYLAAPEERAAIGTREGYDRLRRALGGGG